MIRTLTKNSKEIYYIIDGKRINGVPPGVSGDMTGVSGDMTGVWGNLTDCKITDEDRKKGIDISELIKPQKGEQK